VGDAISRLCANLAMRVTERKRNMRLGVGRGSGLFAARRPGSPKYNRGSS
jgi:hypothetical protein